MRRRPPAMPRPAARERADSQSSSPTAGRPGADEPAEDTTKPVVTIDDANFFDATAGRFTLVDFWAAWCGPCRTFGPLFAEVATRHTGPVRFGACNVDENPRTASLLGIRSIPTLVVFGPDGSEVTRTGPLPQAQLDELVSRLAGSES